MKKRILFLFILIPALAFSQTPTRPTPAQIQPSGAASGDILKWNGSAWAPGTEVDGSVTNEGSLTVAAGGANDSQITSNTSGSTAVVISGGANVTVTESGSTITIAATGGGSADLTFSGASSPVTLNSSTGTDVTFTAGGIVTFSATSGNITITGTEVDGSVSNEGSLTVAAGGSNDSQIASNTSGATNVTISGGIGIQVTESGSTITISATGTTLNSQTGTSYTLVIGDAGKMVTMNNASANTLTVPPNSSVAFAVGTVVNIASIGAGQTTVAQGSGVTIGSANSRLKLRVQYSSGSLIKTGTDTWLLVGDITN